jgi:hypothetical protein
MRIQGNDSFSAPEGTVDLVDQSACSEVFALCVTPVQVRTRHALLITVIRVTRGMSKRHPKTVHYH